MAASEHLLAEVAVGMALRGASKASPPRFEDRPLSLCGVAMGGLLADVGVFVVHAAMVVDFFQKPVAAEVIGVLPTTLRAGGLPPSYHDPTRRDLALWAHAVHPTRTYHHGNHRLGSRPRRPPQGVAFGPAARESSAPSASTSPFKTSRRW